MFKEIVHCSESELSKKFFVRNLLIYFWYIEELRKGRLRINQIYQNISEDLMLKYGITLGVEMISKIIRAMR